MREFLFALTAVIFLTFGSFESKAQLVNYSNDFLNIGVGARALGMGNAQVASTGDVTAGFYNPAGLTQIDGKVEIGLMHQERFAGVIKYDYIGAAYQLVPKFERDAKGEKTIGLTIIRMGVDNILNTTLLVEPDGSINYDNISTFSAADYGILLSYAQAINISKKRPELNTLTLGASAKVVYRTVGEFGNSIGFGIDVGAQYKYKNLDIGIMFKDISTTFNAWSFDIKDEEVKEVFVSTGNEIPVSNTEITAPQVQFGAAYKFKFADDKLSVLPEINFNIPFDGTAFNSNTVALDPRFGLEAGYNDFVFLRFGMHNFQSVFRDDSDTEKKLSVDPSFGLGFDINKKVKIDYTLSNLTGFSTGLYSHVISLTINLADKTTNNVSN